MRGGIGLVSAAAVLAAGALLPEPRAHCTQSVPEVAMSYPAEGVAVQEACYEGFGGCYLDTFYLDTLSRRMADAYRGSKHAVYAYVDSVQNYLTLDTTFYMGRVYYVDTFQTERVHISIQADLKGSMPVRRLALTDRWFAFAGNPYATTYIPLMDTPFVAFFDAYDSLRQLGIGPMDGCFFEPTAYFVYGGRIHRKGLDSERMPGISLPLEDFFRAVGREPVEAPPVRPKTAAIRASTKARRRAFPTGQEGVDAAGRRVEGGRGGEKRAPWYPAWGLPRPDADAPPAR